MNQQGIIPAIEEIPASPTNANGPIPLGKIYVPLTLTRAGAQKGTIEYKPRRDVDTYVVSFPFDWRIDPFHDANWNSQLHMWRLGDFLLREFDEQGTPASLDAFIAIVLDWHRHHVVEGLTSLYVWQDMTVGMRAMKLAYLISQWQHRRIVLSKATERAFLDLVNCHLCFLLDLTKVKFTNHTFSDILGAMALAQVLAPDTRTRIETFVSTVVHDLLSRQFTPEGIHRENSPEYHRFGTAYLRKLLASGWFDQFGIREVLAKANAATSWFCMPDGRTAAIGDTNATPARTERPAFKGRNQTFSSSGYVVVRDDGDGNLGQSSYLMFMGAYNSKAHKHADDLSVVWFHGEDILSDSGKYAYKNDEYRKFFVSRRAHNTVAFEPSRPLRPYGSAIRQVGQHSWGQLIEAAVNFPDVVHRRYCLYSIAGWMLLVDHLDAQTPRHFTQWSHFAPDIRDFSASDNGYDARLRSGRSLAIRYASGPTVQFVKGSMTPCIQGWVSRSYANVEPRTAMGLSQQGTQAAFATLYSIEDPGSGIAWSASNQLSATVGENSFIIDIGSDRCEVAVTGSRTPVPLPLDREDAA